MKIALLSRAVAMTLSALALAAVVAAFPVSASAAVTPSLSVSQGANNSPGGIGSVSFTIGFSETAASDAVQDVSILMPPGLLVSEETDNGDCLSSTTPTPPCEIGSGSADIAGVSTPMTLYLVRAPASTALAGIELVAGSLSLVGDLNLRSSSNLGFSSSLYAGDVIQFEGLSASPVESLSFTFPQLTLPSSCQPATVYVSATSRADSVPVYASAPYTLGGCGDVNYAPAAQERIARDSGKDTATFVVNILDPPGSVATEDVNIQMPANLSMNPALDPCLQGMTCTVGTVTATSPIMPDSQLQGTITLSGTAEALDLGIGFPEPLDLKLSSAYHAGFKGKQLLLTGLPDIPLTSLELSFTGNSLGRAFISECYENDFGATFTPWSGAAPMLFNGSVVQTGCSRAKPPTKHKKAKKKKKKSKKKGKKK